MNWPDYKKYHESFMQNNNGTTPIHTFMHILFTVQGTLFCSLNRKCTKKTYYLYDYALVILPMIVANTILAHYIYYLNIVLSTFLIFKVMYQISEINIKEVFLNKNTFPAKRISSITCMRGLTYLITVFCILAVDFQDFPRYLAKTEKFGYSLMDTGVGLFVVMSGLVHKDTNKQNCKDFFKDNYKLFTILIFLGTARFIAVKELDYQEHVTEYGVHWNFFFTIAVCKLFSSVILMFISNNALITSIAVICIHQYCLIIGLQAWVFGDTPRDNIVNANREGIVSCLGYISIYLYAVYVKKILKNESISRINVMKKLMFNCLFLWILSFVANMYLPISRALANMGYCSYVSAVTLTIIIILYFFEIIFQKTYNTNCIVPSTLLAINSHGLTFFLIANLLTGLVNKITRTLLLPYMKTFLILNMYMLASVQLVVYLNKRKINV